MKANQTKMKMGRQSVVCAEAVRAVEAAGPVVATAAAEAAAAVLLLEVGDQEEHTGERLPEERQAETPSFQVAGEAVLGRLVFEGQAT